MEPPLRLPLMLTDKIPAELPFCGAFPQAVQLLLPGNCHRFGPKKLIKILYGFGRHFQAATPPISELTPMAGVRGDTGQSSARPVEGRRLHAEEVACRREAPVQGAPAEWKAGMQPRR